MMTRNYRLARDTYADSPRGRDRRAERRAAINRKLDWLNSGLSATVE